MRRRACSGFGSTILASAALALGAVLGSPATGFGDTAPIPFSASVPGTHHSHATALERLASRIASHIAGRTVTVRCVGSSESRAVATHAGGSTRLAPEICWPLQQFAEASTKPRAPIASRRTPAYRAAYDLDAVAILTLANESLHLGGVAGSTRAVCLRMQWMPYVAEQLGASPEAAQAIARWARAGRRGPAACRPGS
jgi:hypothetical protein